MEPHPPMTPDSTPDDSTAVSGQSGVALVETAVFTLRTALQALFNHPELLGLSTSALARELDVDRSTLQRLVQAARSKPEAREILTVLPGFRGMRRCLESWQAWAKDAPSRKVCDTALSAADELDRTVRRVGGTRPRVLDAMRGAGVTGASSPAESLRERLFLDAAELVGSSCATALKFFAYGRSDANPRRIDRTTLEAMYGYASSSSAVPVLLSLNTYYQAASAGPKTDHAPKGWVPSLSSEPPMVVSARTSATRDALVLTEPDGGPSRSRDLCVVAERRDYSEHPASLETPLQEVLGMVHYPTRRLLQVVLLERSLYRESSAQWAETKLWRPSLGSLHGDRFLFCLPDAPALQIVDGVPSGLSVEGFPRLADAATHLLEEAGWNADDFVALLIDVEFPVWRAGYSVGVEFG